MASQENGWGIEHSCDTLWIGPMRPDGEKVDQVVVSLACGSDLTHAAQVQQHQHAEAIVVGVRLRSLAQETRDFNQARASEAEAVGTEAKESRLIVALLDRLLEASSVAEVK